MRSERTLAEVVTIVELVQSFLSILSPGKGWIGSELLTVTVVIESSNLGRLIIIGLLIGYFVRRTRSNDGRRRL